MSKNNCTVCQGIGLTPNIIKIFCQGNHTSNITCFKCENMQETIFGLFKECEKCGGSGISETILCSPSDY